MGDNGFHTWFRDFATETLYAVWGNPNAPALSGSEHTSQPATELAASDASELPKRGTCDCCGERPWTHHVQAHQTSAQCETFACCECANCDGCED
jgi:hypothetical protein